MSLICYYMYNIQCIVNSLRVSAVMNLQDNVQGLVSDLLIHGTCVCIDNKLDSSYTNALSTSLTSSNISLYSGMRLQCN